MNRDFDIFRRELALLLARSTFWEGRACFVKSEHISIFVDSLIDAGDSERLIILVSVYPIGLDKGVASGLKLMPVPLSGPAVGTVLSEFVKETNQCGQLEWRGLPKGRYGIVWVPTDDQLAPMPDA
ncbi:MAG: hypothetical protein HY459_04440 [Parcubacteria group bacterium]|nr:hypothetical protein [Parcubacteria group bacterium]